MGRLQNIIMRIRQREESNPYWKILKFAVSQYTGRRLQIISLIAASIFLTCAELFIPVFTGRLIDKVSKGISDVSDTGALLLTIVILGIISVIMRDKIFRVIIYFTAGIMRAVVVNVFSRIQRLSTEWHINNRAGSTLRRLSRGVLAIDLFNYLIFIELIPSTLILVGAATILGIRWPMVGAIVGTCLLLFVCITIMLVQRYLSPCR